MNNDIVTPHRRTELGDILSFAAYDGEPGVVQVMFVMPFPSGREIVVNSHSAARRSGQQRVGEVTSNEAGATDDEIRCRPL
jgi:hypothetical protein